MGLRRRQADGKDNGKKELPLRSAGGCSLGVALDPAEPYTPPSRRWASTQVGASNWAAPDWGQGAKRHQRRETRR